MQKRLQSLIALAVNQFQKTSLVSKAMCGVFVVLYLLGFIPGVEKNLALTPGFLAPPHVKLWTIATATLYENGILYVILDVIAIICFSLILEPLWGLKEFLIFTAMVSCVSMTATASLCLIVYAISGSISALFAHLHGMVGLACGFLVAVMQAHPDSVAFPPPAPPTLRVKHLPLAVTLTTLILALFKVISFTHTFLAACGTVSAWCYLRFYQRREQGLKGDMAEGFEFAVLFPEFLHPLVSSMGEVVFRVFVRLRICPKAVKRYDVGAPSAIKISLPGSEPADAERRKQRALKALDERLSKSTQSSAIAWPSMEDTGSSGEEHALPVTHPQPTSGGSPSVGKPEAVAVEDRKSDHSVSGSSAGGQQGGAQMATTSSSSSLTKHDL